MPRPRNNDRHHEPHGRREPPISGPGPADVTDALDQLATGDPTDTPPLAALRTLEAAGIEPPITIRDRRILDWSIQSGDPMHGAKRSDDHISRWQVEHVTPEECPECGAQTAVFEYRAHHNIAGEIARYCPTCDHVHDREHW